MAKRKSEYEFDFEADQKEADNINDINDKILYWKKRLKDYKQQNDLFDLSNYEQNVKLEIDYLWDCTWGSKTETIAKVETTQLPETESNFEKSINVEPIWWKRNGRLLKYLMDELARLDMIDRESPVNKHIKQHFIDKHKQPFKKSIAQNSSGAGNNKGTSKNSKGKPKGHEEVDHIINKLKDKSDKSD